MIVRHENGRIHVGVLFQEASNKCTDECGTGTVCFEHMTERLKEVADHVKQLELQIDSLKNELDKTTGAWAVAADERDRFSGKLQESNRLMASMKNIVDAAVEWWADPNDTTKTIVDLQNAVEAYWEDNKEKHVTEKRFCECSSPRSKAGTCTQCGLHVKNHFADAPTSCCYPHTPGMGCCCGCHNK